MTRRLAAKVASAVRQRFVKSSSMATFKRVRRRVISAAAPLGKATGFCVSARRARLVGCSAGRMAAHTKAAPDDNVLRLIDRALGKLNDSAGFSPRPGLVAQAPRPLDRRLKVVDLGTTPLGSLGSTSAPPRGSTPRGAVGIPTGGLPVVPLGGLSVVPSGGRVVVPTDPRG